MSVVVSGSSVPAFPIAIARPESALPTTYIIGKFYSALAPSPIVGVGVLPLAVESSAIGVLSLSFQALEQEKR